MAICDPRRVCSPARLPTSWSMRQRNTWCREGRSQGRSNSSTVESGLVTATAAVEAIWTSVGVRARLSPQMVKQRPEKGVPGEGGKTGYWPNEVHRRGVKNTGTVASRQLG